MKESRGSLQCCCGAEIERGELFLLMAEVRASSERSQERGSAYDRRNAAATFNLQTAVAQAPMPAINLMEPVSLKD